MKRGEIYFISSTYKEEGSEQRADRPAVIVSNNKCNEHSEVVEIVYMTTRPKADLPTHVFTRSALVPSTILCEQIHSISKSRVGALIGNLTEGELQSLNSALMISLGLGFTPTDEELEEIKKKLKETKPMVIPETDQSAALIKAETERDIYRDLYHDLLKHMKGQ